MSTFFGIRELHSAEDWRQIVEQDKREWRCGKSAYELAHHWQGCRGFPERVKAVLSCASDRRLQRLSAKYGFVEWPMFLDTFRAPSRTDVMVYCYTEAEELVVVGVEGKATERFAEPVRDWIRGGKEEPTPSRTRRLSYLSMQLGVDVPPDSTFGYQLVHRTASVVMEAILREAAAGIVLIHSFSDEAPENWCHFAQFTDVLGVPCKEKDVLAGPAWLGPNRSLEVWFGWVSDHPTPSRTQPD